MTKDEKRMVFSLMLKDFETQEMKDYFMDMVEKIPDYIFTMPSSTSGKYHNITQCQRFGQVYHVYMFASILNHRLRLEWNKQKFSDPLLRDAMRCVAVFHDAVKCGWNGSQYTVDKHPVLAAEWVRNTVVEHDINNLYKEAIAKMCEAHSGEWNTNKTKQVIMPKPRTEAEFFIHECDILSSRKDIDMIIPEELRNILINLETVELPTPESYRIGFGKYAGKTLEEIQQCDPSYIRWLRDNCKDETIRMITSKM